MLQAKALLEQRTIELEAKRRLVADQRHSAARSQPAGSAVQGRGGRACDRRGRARPRRHHGAVGRRHHRGFGGRHVGLRLRRQGNRPDRRSRSDARRGRGVRAQGRQRQGRRHRRGEARVRTDPRGPHPLRVQVRGRRPPAPIGSRSNCPMPTAPSPTASRRRSAFRCRRCRRRACRARRWWFRPPATSACARSMRNPRSDLLRRPSSRTISVRCGSPACRMARASSCRARTSFAKAIWSSRSPRPRQAAQR